MLDAGREFLRLSTPADVRDFMKHLLKERQQFDTWQTVARRLSAAAAGGDIDDVSISLRMFLQLENVEYQMKEGRQVRRPHSPRDWGSLTRR
jgi:hypothetical protein